jgi:FMN reductase
MPAVLVISGSPSTTSKTEGIAEHVVRWCRTLGHPTDHLRVRELPPRALLAGDRGDPEVARAVHAVESADGVVLATPIYQAAYSGLLKAFLDTLPQFAFAGKIVFPLATGGSLAHVLALDYGLRPVIQSLAPRHVVQSLFVLGTHIASAQDGVVIDNGPAALLRDVVDDFHRSLAESPRQVTIPRSA